MGVIIEDFWLEFKDGKVVDFDVCVEKDVLKNILDFDVNLRYIGEIVFILYNLLILNMDILFLNILFDENVSCYMVFGCVYLMNIKNGN